MNKDIAKYGHDTQVTAESQPPVSLKKMGWKRRKLTKELLEARITIPSDADKAAKLQLLAANFGLEIKDMTNIIAMNLALVDAVIYKQDVRAYEALTNRGFGLPASLKFKKEETSVHWTIEVIKSRDPNENT